jgi:SAM-dependent methyltransferase
MESDSATSGFWDARYAKAKTPWDYQGVPEQVRGYLSRTPVGRVLIPGCGSGYEVVAFRSAGWSVTAIDFSEVAVERAKRTLGADAQHVLFGDFFKHEFKEGEFDLIYERAFLCALPPRRWPDYARRMSQLIRPSGKLAGFFLYGEEHEPPPYPMSEEQARELFEGTFACTHDEPATGSVPFFAGRERWQEWTRKTG